MSSTVFNNRIMDLTYNAILPEVVGSISDPEAKDWFITWQKSSEAAAIAKQEKLAYKDMQRTGLKVRSCYDKRTKIGKDMIFFRVAMVKRFELQYGEMPHQVNPLMQRILSKWD